MRQKLWGEGDGEEHWTVLKTGFVLEGENNSTSSGFMVLKTCVWATTPFLEQEVQFESEICLEGRSRLDNRIHVIQIPWIETANRLTLWLGGKHELGPKILKATQFKGTKTCEFRGIQRCYR